MSESSIPKSADDAGPIPRRTQSISWITEAKHNAKSRLQLRDQNFHSPQKKTDKLFANYVNVLTLALPLHSVLFRHTPDNITEHIHQIHQAK